MGRPKKPLISRENAVRAAIEVIDADGLDAFSLGSVAQRLGVKSPSLYYHFSDKAELLALVARSMLLGIRYNWGMAGSWEERTITLCLETRRSLLKHPNATPLLLQFFPRRLLLGAYEATLRDYPPLYALQMAMLEAVEKLTFGSTLFAAAAQARGLAPMPDVNPETYPRLAKAIETNPFDDEGTFVQALRILFAGMRTLTDQLTESAAV